MDRRQKKTRKAIFDALVGLLSEKPFNKITVEEIINRADVGRATFYSHFETKDFLLKELCKELFCHIFDSISINKNEHKHIFECDSDDSVFLHILKHIEKNDNQLLKLLSSQNNNLFLDYFKEEFLVLIKKLKVKESVSLPDDFWINYIATTFVETIRWWINDKKLRVSAETANDYFLSVINFGKE